MKHISDYLKKHKKINEVLNNHENSSVDVCFYDYGRNLKDMNVLIELNDYIIKDSIIVDTKHSDSEIKKQIDGFIDMWFPD